MNKKIALFLSMLLLLQVTSFAIEAPVVSVGTLDAEFNSGRTFYNVLLPDGTTEVPEITASGASLVKKAEGITEEYGNDRITILKDDETGKLYRFKFLVNEKKAEISKFSIDSAGLITVEAKVADGTNIKTVIYTPTAELSETSNSPETLATETKGNIIAFSNDENTSETKATYQLPANARSGMYRVVIGGNGVTTAGGYAEAEYYYLSSSAKAALLTTLSKITTIEENTEGTNEWDVGLTKFLQENGTKLNIDFSEYNAFSDKSVLLKLLCAESFVEKPDDLLVAYEDAKLITTINLSSGNELLSLIAGNKKKIGFDTTLFDQIEDRTAFTALWKNSGAASYDELKAYFKKVAAAAYVDEADPEKLPERLGNAYSILGITTDTYNTMLALVEYDDFIIELSRKTDFNTADDISSWITTKVSEYKANESAGGTDPVVTPTPSTPSTTPSSSSSSSGVSFKTDIIPEATPEPEKEKPTVVLNQDVFSDIDSVPWAKEAILLLEDWEIIKGVGDGKFDPLANVTREQFVHMVVTAFSISGDVENVNFTDVDENAWYYNSLKAALARKIITGITSKEFGTGKYITRQDMAVILERVTTSKGISVSADMYPIKINDLDSCAEYAKSAVTTFTRANIMTGSGDGSFAPYDNATRAMAAVVIYRLMKLN